MADNNSQLERQNAELKRQIRELKEERAKDAAFLKSFCKDLADLRLLIQDLNDPTDSTMANKLIVSNEHVVSLLSQINEYKQEISDLKEQIVEANEIAEQNAVLQQNIRYLEAELDNLNQNATNQQLEAQLDASNKENASLKDEKEMVEKELAEETDRTNVLAASNIHLCGKVETYRQQIKELKENREVQSRRFCEIFEELDPLEEQRNELFNSLMQRVSVNMNNAQYGEALELLLKALMVEESGRNNAKKLCGVYIIISGCCYAMKMYKNALEAGERAVNHDPTEAMGYYARGKAHKRLGNRIKAIADFQKAAELNPNHQEFQTALANTSNHYLNTLLASNNDTHVPGYKNFTNEQTFFISAGVAFCNWQPVTVRKISATTDEHAPNFARINTQFANYPEFAKAFQCKEGTKMNPTNRCEVY